MHIKYASIIFNYIMYVFSVIGEKESDIDKQSILLLEQAFANIKDATGQDDIDTIVHNFIKKEDEIFALYNYVSPSMQHKAITTIFAYRLFSDYFPFISLY